MATVQNFKLDSSAEAVVNKSHKLKRFGPDTPINKKCLLGNKEAGSCYPGVVTSEMIAQKTFQPGEATHWAPLPTFED